MCEVVDLGGLKPVHLARVDAEVLGLTARGLVHLVEVSDDRLSKLEELELIMQTVEL